MEKTILVIKNCLAEIMNHLMFLAFEWVLFYGFIKIKPGIFLMIIPLLVPLFYYFVRCKVQNVFLFFGLHFLMIIVIFYGYQNVLIQRIIFSIAAVIQAITSIVIRVRKREWGSEPLWPLAAVGICLFLFAMDSTQGGKSSSVLIQIIFLFLILYFFYLYLNNYLQFIKTNRRITSDIPEKQIFKFDLFLVVGFTTCCAIFSVLFINRKLIQNISDKIYTWIRAMLVALFTFLSRFQAMEEGTPIEEEVIKEIEDMEELLPELQGQSLLTEIINQIILFLGKVATFAIIIIVIYLMIKVIQRAFARWDRKSEEKADTSEGDRVEKLNRKKEKVSNDILPILFQTPEEKIRKIFIKAAMKKYKLKPSEVQEGLLRYRTARECLELFWSENEKEAIELIEIYEKARYGNHQCTQEDVKEAKRIVSLL